MGQIFNNNKGTFVINERNEIIFIPTEDIIFIEKDKNNLIIHTKDESYETIATLLSLEPYLDNRFIKVHKCYIVNENRIKRMVRLENRSYRIEFNNTTKYAFMSRYRFNEIESLLSLWI